MTCDVSSPGSPTVKQLFCGCLPAAGTQSLIKGLRTFHHRYLTEHKHAPKPHPVQCGAVSNLFISPLTAKFGVSPVGRVCLLLSRVCNSLAFITITFLNLFPSDRERFQKILLSTTSSSFSESTLLGDAPAPSYPQS